MTGSPCTTCHMRRVHDKNRPGQVVRTANSNYGPDMHSPIQGKAEAKGVRGTLQFAHVMHQLGGQFQGHSAAGCLLSFI